MSSSVTFDSGRNGRGHARDVFVKRGTINLGTYATGGVAITKSTFEYAVEIVDVDVRPSAGYIVEWDKTNSKLKVYDQKDPGAAGGADIALPQVGNGVDLSAVNFRFRAEGR